MDYAYDDIGQLKTAQGWEDYGGTPRLHEQFGYAYDAAWNLSHRTNNALIQSFGVNNLNELTSATRDGTLTVAGTTTSPATNVTVSGTGLSSAEATRYSDSTWVREGATLADGINSCTATAQDNYGRADTATMTVNLPLTNTFVYDLNGNLRTNNTRIYEYDDENQLIRVIEPNAWKSEFTYDGLMRRRVRQEFRWSGAWVKTNEVRYVCDGMLAVQERDGNNVPQVTYTRGNDLSASLQGAGGIGGLLARTDNALLAIGDSRASAFYHSDGNGNVTCMVNTNGAIVAKYQYDPYGNLLSLSGPLAEANTYRFSSKEWHLNSGLYYYGFRFYSPSLQRWPNSDPLGDIGSLALMTAAARPTVEGERFVEKVLRSKEESDSLNDTPSLSDWSQVNLNLFGGIGNDPVNMTDPFGLDANSYADCIERYRNPLTEQLPNAIAENLGSGRRVPGWVPPGVHGANAAGNLLAGPVRGGVPSVSGPGHPTTWQHKLLGAKYTGWSMIALTVFEGFWDLGILAGCGIAEAMEIPDPLYRGGAYEGPGRRW